MDDNDSVRTCACGKKAVKVTNLDTGIYIHCGETECAQRASREIEEAALTHPVRLQVFDAAKPLMDEILGHDPPTDRVLAYAYGMLDATSPIIAALMKVPTGIAKDALGAAMAQWSRDSINDLAKRLRVFSVFADAVVDEETANAEAT